LKYILVFIGSFLFCLNSQAVTLDYIKNGLVASDRDNGSLALRWYQKGVLNNDPACSVRLAEMLENGLSVKKNIDEASRLRLSAATAGLVVFPGQIPNCYRKSHDLYLECKISDTGDWSVYLGKMGSLTENKFYEITRWVQMAWSPDGNRLLITDGVGSDETDSYIYKLGKTGAMVKEADLFDEFKKSADEKLDEFEKDHFYLEGVEWINDSSILVNITGHAGQKNFYRIYIYDYKNGFRKIKWK
jgi:TPR repeat protein